MYAVNYPNLFSYICTNTCVHVHDDLLLMKLTTAIDAIKERFESVKLPMSFVSFSCGLTVDVHANTVPEQKVPNVAFEQEQGIKN